jgi:hypothetical protein
MSDITSNIVVQTVGTTASIATDYGTSGVNLSSAHIPLNKLAFGGSGQAIRVSASDPMPITVLGSDVAIAISGNVGNCGAFGINNYNSEYLKVAGSTSGAGITVQGTVGITATELSITGGIISGLNSTRDSVGITGSASLIDIDGTTGAAVKLYSGLTAIGVSGDALKVAVVGTGFTASITLGAVVGVTNNGILKVQGDTGGLLLGITSGSLNIAAISLPSAFTAGQFSVISTTAKQMPAFVMGSGSKLKALSTNTSSIYVGHSSGLSTSTGFPLLAGESCFIEVNNLNLLYVVGGATGQTITYFGS